MCDALPAARAVDTQRVEHHHAARQDRRAVKVPHGKGGIGHDVLPAAGHHELIRSTISRNSSQEMGCLTER